MDILEEVEEGYVDDTEVFCSSDSDFLAVDKCVARFERVSGAILNRSTKSVVLGLGNWKDRTSWPLPWLKTVSEMKVFGFILHPDYSEIIDKNWTEQLNKFRSVLFSWTSRVINSLFQRAEILSIFALSTIWYRAQVLPLPMKYAVQFEKEISNLLWKGHMTKNVLSRETVCLSKERGGLAVPHLRIKCKSLRIKQMLRNITGTEKGKEHIDFWLGERLGLPQLSSSLYHLRKQNQDSTPVFFTSALTDITEALSNGVFTVPEIKDVTVKQIYKCYLEDLPSPLI